MAEQRIIDVSEHQGKIDWKRVKDYVDGAILRTGYGDNLPQQDDKYFEYNVEQCEKYGIPYGTYLYSYAGNLNQIKSEIEHEKRVTKGHNPVAFSVYIFPFDIKASSRLNRRHSSLKWQRRGIL